MSSRTYLCETCGKSRRTTKVYRGVGRMARPWPLCCKARMTSLTDIQAEGAAKLRPTQRLTWSALGKRMIRDRLHGPGKWKPVLASRGIARAVAQEERYRRQMDGAV